MSNSTYILLAIVSTCIITVSCQQKETKDSSNRVIADSSIIAPIKFSKIKEARGYFYTFSSDVHISKDDFSFSNTTAKIPFESTSKDSLALYCYKCFTDKEQLLLEKNLDTSFFKINKTYLGQLNDINYRGALVISTNEGFMDTIFVTNDFLYDYHYRIFKNDSLTNLLITLLQTQ